MTEEAVIEPIEAEATEVIEAEAPAEQGSEPTEIEEAVTSDDGEETTAEQPKKSKGVQKRIDELTANYRSAERDRDYWREMAMQNSKPEPVQEQPQAVSQEGEPQLDAYEDYDQYVKDLAGYQAKQIIDQERTAAQQRVVEEQKFQAITSFNQKENEFAQKHEDYFQVTRDPSVAITEPMIDVLSASDIGAELTYHLASNKDEAMRIAQLSPIQQARELGIMEARLKTPPPKTQTSAPEPITPVSGNEAPLQDMENMSIDDWMKARQKQL